MGSSIDPRGAENRLERSVASALRAITAACAEREDEPVYAARQHLRTVYGRTRLRRRLEQDARPA